MEQKINHDPQSHPLNPGILIIDDEVNIFRSIRANLGNEFTFFYSPDASSSLALLEKEPVNLCILDFKLPDVNGLEFLQTLKKTMPIFLSL